MRFPALLLLCCVVVGYAQAPSPQITRDGPVDLAILGQWLHSGDPRLMAWASDFAQRRHDQQILTQIPALLEHWSMPPMAGGYEEQAAQRRAVLALLDALIQEKMALPLITIERMAEEYPAQAALLIERIPLNGSRSTLAKWALAKPGTLSTNLTHAAAMRLAKSPDTGFVYDVLGRIVQRVTVRILPPGMGAGGSGGMSCGDSAPLPPTPGWPTVYAYSLREVAGVPGDEDPDEKTVAALGERTIVAYRFEDNRGGGSCSKQETESAFFQELVAYWLGVKASKMNWQPEEALNIEWTTQAAYEQELGAFVEADRARLSAARMKLRELKLLDEREIDSSFPQITLKFECHIAPCPLPGVATYPD